MAKHGISWGLLVVPGPRVAKYLRRSFQLFEFFWGINGLSKSFQGMRDATFLFFGGAILTLVKLWCKFSANKHRGFTYSTWKGPMAQLPCWWVYHGCLTTTFWVVAFRHLHSPQCNSSWWLVHQSNLKNMRKSNWIQFSPRFGVKIPKDLWVATTV